MVHSFIRLTTPFVYLDARVDSEGLEQLGEGGEAASLLVESPTQSTHSKSSVTTAVPAEPLNPATEALR